jgi:hypothetical protein
MTGAWVRRPLDGRAVVFVHGIFSQPYASWRHNNGTYWPELFAAEPEVAQVGIYVFSYQTDFFSGTYRLGNAVDALKEHLRLDGVLDLREIVFVSHSMGGIIVRKFVVERAQDLVERNISIGLFLIASPSLGSQYANWFAWLARVMGHSQAEALQFGSNNSWLCDLDKEFQNVKEGARLRLRGKELVEDKSVVARRFWRDPVVEEFSAARYFGEAYKVPGSDHFSIATPPDRDAIQHRLLCEFVAAEKPHGDAFATAVAFTPSVRPTKSRALLDRRLVSDLLVAFAGRGRGWEALDADVQGAILYGLSYYDQLLVENVYASTLHHGLLKRDSVPKKLRDAIVVTTHVRPDPFIAEVMSEAGEGFASEPLFTLSVAKYDKTRSGGPGSPVADIEFLLQTMRLAAAFDAAILPYPKRWPLYRTCFEICANRTEPQFRDTTVPLPGIPSTVSMKLRHFGPCAFPYPSRLLDSYDKTDLDELRKVTFEFCVPMEDV